MHFQTTQALELIASHARVLLDAHDDSTVDVLTNVLQSSCLAKLLSHYAGSTDAELAADPQVHSAAIKAVAVCGPMLGPVPLLRAALEHQRVAVAEAVADLKEDVERAASSEAAPKAKGGEATGPSEAPVAAGADESANSDVPAEAAAAEQAASTPVASTPVAVAAVEEDMSEHNKGDTPAAADAAAAEVQPEGAAAPTTTAGSQAAAGAGAGAGAGAAVGEATQGAASTASTGKAVPAPAADDSAAPMKASASMEASASTEHTEDEALLQTLTTIVAELDSAVRALRAGSLKEATPAKTVTKVAEVAKVDVVDAEGGGEGDAATGKVEEQETLPLRPDASYVATMTPLALNTKFQLNRPSISHHYKPTIESDSKKVSRSCLKRVRSELRALRRALPVQLGSSILVQADKARPYVRCCFTHIRTRTLHTRTLTLRLALAIACTLTMGPDTGFFFFLRWLLRFQIHDACPGVRTGRHAVRLGCVLVRHLLPHDLVPQNIAQGQLGHYRWSNGALQPQRTCGCLFGLE